MFLQKCGTTMNDDISFCPICGEPVQQKPTSQQPQQPIYAAQSEKPMKWFKFLIYFGLFASGILNLSHGLQLITGSIYNGDADLVYTAWESMKTLDIIVGILGVALAALAIFTRTRLAGFYKDGPKMILLLYVCAVVVNLVYLIGLNSILPQIVIEKSGIAESFIGSVVLSVAMVIANKTYFDKRKELFNK